MASYFKELCNNYLQKTGPKTNSHNLKNMCSRGVSQIHIDISFPYEGLQANEQIEMEGWSSSGAAAVAGGLCLQSGFGGSGNALLMSMLSGLAQAVIHKLIPGSDNRSRII